MRARRGTISTGGEVDLVVPFGWWKLPWTARHEGLIDGKEFADVQVTGPFKAWRHVHRVRPDGAGCVIEDQVEYTVPGGALGQALIGRQVERQLDRLFAWRHRRLIDDLARHAAHAAAPRLRVAISGASGMVGTALTSLLGGGGHTVVPLVRRGGEGIAWDPGRSIDAAALGACDAVVHLAGRNVGDAAWSPAVKSEIWSSRVDATRHLCEVLAAAASKPRVLICASGMGYYGSVDAAVKEDSPGGQGFLADVCKAWEAATEPARAAGIRVVNLRFGVVLSLRGGALAKLRRPVLCGVAGPVGGGRQALSWIALDDAIGIIHDLLFRDEISGPINVVAPQPTTNAGLIQSIGRALRRPTILPLPAFAVRRLFGEMGESTLLANHRVLPARLLGFGFDFRHRDLDGFLRWELGR